MRQVGDARERADPLHVVRARMEVPLGLGTNDGNGITHYGLVNDMAADGQQPCRVT